MRREVDYSSVRSIMEISEGVAEGAGDDESSAETHHNFIESHVRGKGSDSGVYMCGQS